LNYKEIFFFIAKSLTISQEKKNRDEIESILKTTVVDWEAVVKISSSHYVFSALYCNLKYVNFLKYLPQELVNWMEHLTNLNRERNKQIISQAHELNTLLLANNITPLFVKGTGNLLAGIYNDIAERMVGDIDFIFSKEDYTKAIKVLTKNGYFFVEKIPYELPYRHFPRLKKKDRIAAVEIHHEIVLKNYTKEFNYCFVEKDSQIFKGAAVLSYANKLNLSIISNQINDNGFYYKTITLRNAYDVFLLSKKTNAKDAVNSLINLTKPLNCFLAACYELFNKVDSLEYENNKYTDWYLSIFESRLINNKLTKFQLTFIKIYLILKNRINIIYKSLIYKEYRSYLSRIVLEKIFNKK